MSISKDDFYLWKSEPITQAFFEGCLERIADAKDIVSTTAGLDPVNDNFYRGFIYAYKEIFDFRVDDQE